MEGQADSHMYIPLLFIVLYISFYLMEVFVEWLSAPLGWKCWEERYQVDFGHFCFPST